RDVVVDRPLIPLDAVTDPLAGLDVDAGQPELPAARRLKIIPDHLAVMAPELVAGDLHVHGAWVHEAQAGAVAADRPDAIDLMPGAFVAEQQQRRIGGRELQVIEPIVAVVAGPDFA